MRRLLFFLAGCACATPAFAEVDFGGVTGLLAVPSAETLPDGSAAFAAARHNPKPQAFDQVDSYNALIGFLPRLEVGGTVTEDASGNSLRDLSLNLKYQLWKFSNGAALAVGTQDLGGQARNFRTSYAVATAPLGPFSITAGYGHGPDVMEGAIGGIAYEPWRFLHVVAEYDADRANAGLRLNSDRLLGDVRIGLTAAWRGATHSIEYGAHVEFPLGRRTASPAPKSLATEPQALALETAALHARLNDLGFESVRVGSRDDGTLVVSLENRRYNQSSADGIGLALGTMADAAPAAVQTLELRTTAYGVPQSTITAPATAMRDFLRDPSRGDALAAALRVRPAGATRDSVAWDGPAATLHGMELVLDPVLRTFVATDVGVLDYAVAARARMTAPLGHGFLANVGAQLPIDDTHDFRGAGTFASFRPRGGPDLATFQYAQKLAPQWSGLWSAGRMRVFSTGWNAAALEQAWVSDDGSHLLRAKLMALKNDAGSRHVALFGYSWFDPARDYSVGLTGGRFYAGDSGVRFDFDRHFGDTIVGLFFKGASRDDQAVGVEVSLPLTPRQDAVPGLVQVKGSRRWGHSLSSTIDTASGINTVRPLLLYEPQFDLDLRRDFLDSGRLGENYLRDELPRMREAYGLWGATGAAAPGDTR